MTFRACIRAGTLTAALEPVYALVEECKLNVNPDGLAVCAVDPANVAMVNIELPADACEEYHANGGVLGINLERLLDVLSMGDNDDIATLELDAETRKLHIDIEGLAYTLALIDPESIRQEPDIPDLDLPGTYVVEGRELARAVRAADLCSDHISLRALSDGEMAFHADGDTDNVNISVSGERLLSGHFGDDEAAESMLSLDYLQDVTRPIDTDTAVSILLGEAFPVKLRYSIDDTDVINMIAPRISSE